ncbi:unnamed protein product [Sphagnum tenellum]
MCDFGSSSRDLPEMEAFSRGSMPGITDRAQWHEVYGKAGQASPLAYGVHAIAPKHHAGINKTWPSDFDSFLTDRMGLTDEVWTVLPGVRQPEWRGHLLNVRDLRHDTNAEAFLNMVNGDDGTVVVWPGRPSKKTMGIPVSWWSAVADGDSIAAARCNLRAEVRSRLMASLKLELMSGQDEDPMEFVKKAVDDHEMFSRIEDQIMDTFFSSPAFSESTSRYGDFGMKCPLVAIMEAYRMARGIDAETLRIVPFLTHQFKYETELALLVCSKAFCPPWAYGMGGPNLSSYYKRWEALHIGFHLPEQTQMIMPATSLTVRRMQPDGFAGLFTKSSESKLELAFRTAFQAGCKVQEAIPSMKESLEMLG